MALRTSTGSARSRSRSKTYKPRRHIRNGLTLPGRIVRELDQPLKSVHCCAAVNRFRRQPHAFAKVTRATAGDERRRRVQQHDVAARAAHASEYLQNDRAVLASVAAADRIERRASKPEVFGRNRVGSQLPAA